MLNENIMQNDNSDGGFAFFSDFKKRTPNNKKVGPDYSDIIELKKKISDSMSAKNQLIQRENYLQSQIETMNKNAEITMNILDERKEQLMIENDNLRLEYEALPPIDFLENQLYTLSNILENSSSKTQILTLDSSVDAKLRKIGILNRDEDCSLLELRLADLIDQTRRTYDPGPPQPIIDKGLPEEKELRKKIQIFKIAAESATLRTKYEIEKIKIDIQKIKDEVDEYYKDLFEIENPQTDKKEDLEEKVRQILTEAGGNIDVFKKVEDNESKCMFEYDKKKIVVFQKYGEFYGECENTEFPLLTLFKTLVTFSHHDI